MLIFTGLVPNFNFIFCSNIFRCVHVCSYNFTYQKTLSSSFYYPTHLCDPTRVMICPASLVTWLALKCNLFCIPTRVAISNYSKSFSITQNGITRDEILSVALRQLHNKSVKPVFAWLKCISSKSKSFSIVEKHFEYLRNATPDWVQNELHFNSSLLSESRYVIRRIALWFIRLVLLLHLFTQTGSETNRINYNASRMIQRGSNNTSGLVYIFRSVKF